jgi:hypothetical protein
VKKLNILGAFLLGILILGFLLWNKSDIKTKSDLSPKIETKEDLIPDLEKIFSPPVVQTGEFEVLKVDNMYKKRGETVNFEVNNLTADSPLFVELISPDNFNNRIDKELRSDQTGSINSSILIEDKLPPGRYLLYVNDSGRLYEDLKAFGEGKQDFAPIRVHVSHIYIE